VFVKAIEVPRCRTYDSIPGHPSEDWELAIKSFGSRVSKDMSEWPADLRAQESPKGESNA